MNLPKPPSIDDIKKYKSTKIEEKKQKDNDLNASDPFVSRSKKIPNIDMKSLKKIKWKDITSYIHPISLLWFILVLVVWYGYTSDLWKKISEIPTLQKNIAILQENIDKQDSEISSLDKINLELDVIREKESKLLKHLPTYNDNLYVEQANVIYKIASEVGMEIESLQKVNIRRSEKRLEDFNIQLIDKWFEPYYDNSWFTKFIISSISSEEVIIRFKEKIENRVEFMFDGFTLNQSDGEIKYSFSLKALYNINQTELWND